MKTNSTRRLLQAATTALAVCFTGAMLPTSAKAGNTWDGGGGDGLWSTAANWDFDTLPGYGTLTFSGATGTTNTVDANTSKNMLLWNGTSAWTLNNSGGAVISLYDNGGTQAKIENQSTGTVTINAPVTYAATTGAAFGELNAVNGDIVFGGGDLTVNGSAVNGLKFWSGAGRTVTFNNTLSATGKWLATTGSGAITIGATGSATAADIFVMNGGSLNLAGSLTSDATKGIRLGGDFSTTGNQDLTKSGTLNLTPSAGGVSYAGIVNAVGSNTSGALAVNSQNTSGTNTLSGAIVLDSNLTINQSAGGTLALTTGGIDLKSLTLTFNAGAAANINASGVISNSSGTGALTKGGAGTVTLSGNNTFGGLIAINEGVVQAGHNNALGAGTTYVGNGGPSFANTSASLLLNTSGLTVNNALVTNKVDTGAGFGTGIRTLGGNFTSGTSTFSGTLALNGGAVLTAGSGGTVNFTGVISNGVDTGNISRALTINAAGGIVGLTNTNTYTGGTTITAGTLSFANGSLGTTGNITMNGGTLQWGTGNTQDISSRLAMVAAKTATYDTNGNNVTLATAIGSSTSASLVKTGTGKLTLSAINTYTGGTTVDAGTLGIIGTGGNTRIVGALTVNSSGTVDVSNGTDTTGLGYNNQLTSVAINGGTITTTGGSHIWNITGGITMTGGTLQSNNGVSTTVAASNQLEWNRTVLNTLASSNTATIAGRINIRSDGSYTGVVFNVAEGAAATDLLVSAGITQASAGMGITKNGAGTMALSAANTYTGATTVNGGTLVLSGANGSVLSSAVTVNSGATLRLDNTTNSANRLGDGLALAINNGTLDFAHAGAAATNYAETIGVVTVSGGTTINTSQAASGQTSILTLAGLAGNVNFSGTGLGVDDRNKIVITGKTTGMMLGSFNTTGLALYDTTLGVTEASYTNVPFAGTISDGAATNIRLTGGASGDVLLGSATTTVNAILQNQTSATTIDSGSQILRLGDAGGILLPTGMASLSIGNGTLTAGGADDTAGTLNLTNNDGTALLTIDSVIANNGSGAVGLVTGGAGKVILAGTNTYTGTSLLGATTTEISGATQTLSGIVSGAGGLLKSNAASTLTLSGANTFTGAINITGGVLKLGNASGLGASSQIVTVSSGATFDLAGSTASRPVTISGTGVSGQAALYNSSTTTGAAISSLKLDNNATITSAVTGSDVNKVVSFGSLDLNGKKLTIGGGGFTVGLHSITSGDIDINSGGFLYSQTGGSQTSVTGTITINTGGVYETRDANNTAMTSVHAIYLNGGTLGRATITNNNGGGAGTILKNNITVDATNGGTITNNTGSFSVYYRLTGALSGSGPLALNGSMGVEFQGDASGYTGTATATNGTVSFSTSGTQVFNGNLAGTRPVVKWGAGTTTLGGTTSFSGALTVNGGTAVLAGASNTASGSTTVNSGATLRLSYGTNDNRKISTGALTLSGGTIELAGGTFADSVASTTLTASTSSTITQSSGTATLNLNAITRNTESFLNFAQSGIARTNNANNALGILGTWATIGGSNWAVNDGSGLIVAATTTDITRLGASASTIADGSTSHVRITEGSGTANNILLGAATTTINTLIQSNIGGTSAATINPAGQTLALNVILVGSGAGSLTIGNGTNNGTLKAAGTNIDFRDVSGAGVTVNSVVADGSGASTVTKIGGGTLTFSGANTYTGGTTVNGGTLTASLGTTTGVRTVFGTGAITANSGTSLIFSAGSTGNAMSHANAINLNGATFRSNDAVQTFSGNIALTGANTVDVVYSGKNAYLTGVVSGAGSINKTSAGTLIVSGNNTYTGGTTLTSGPLRAASSGAFGAAGQTLTLNGGTLELGSDTVLTTKAVVIGANAAITLDRASFGTGLTTTLGNLTSISGSRTLTFTRGSNVVGATTLAFNGTSLALAGQTTTFAVGANAIVDLSGGGLLAGAQTVSIVKSDAGTLILGEYGNWDGGSNTSLTGGTLELRGVMGDSGVFRGLTASAGTTLRLANDSNKLYYSGVTAAGGMTIEAGRITSGTTSMTHSLSTLSLGGALNVNRASSITGAGIGTTAFTGATTLTANSTFNVGANAELNLQGAVGGAFTLTKSGAGTLSLNGTATYTGASTLSGGTTTLSGASGAIATSSGITINGGATLTLANTSAANNGNRIAGTLALNGGTLNFTNNAGAVSYSETTGALSIGGGGNTIATGQAASGQTSILTFASLSRTSGLLNFAGTGLGTTVDTKNEIRFTTNPTLSNGIIGIWATVNGTDFATTTGANNNVVAYNAYTDVTRFGAGAATIANTAANNVRIVEGTPGSAFNILLAAPTTTINTLTQSASGGTSAATIDPDATNTTLAVNSILVANGAGGLTIGATAGDGTLKSAGTDLSISSYGANSSTINSVIADGAGASTLTKGGTGTFSLAGVNTFTGGINVAGGTLQISGAGTIGASASYSQAITNNGVLQFSSSAAQTITSAVTGAGSILKDGAGNLVMGSSTFAGNTFTGGLTVTNGLVTIQGNNNGASVAGPGTLTIGTGATVRALSHNALGQGGGTLTPLFVNGGTFEGAEYNHINTITMTGGTISQRSGITVVDGLDMKVYGGVNPSITTNAATGSATISLKISNSAGPLTLTVADGAAASDLVISGVVAGSNPLVKTGAGLLELTGNNTYTGGTALSQGTLTARVTNGQNALGTGRVAVGTGTILNLNDVNTTNDTVVANVFSGPGTINVLFANAGTARNTRINTANALADFTGSLVLGLASGATTTGDKLADMAGTTAASLTIGSGTQLYVSNVAGATFNGGVTVSGTGNTETRGAIRLGATLGGNLNLAADSTIGTEGGTLTGNISTTTAGLKTLTLGTTNSTGNAVLSGSISNGSGSIALLKTQAGTLTLSGASSYGGSTTINAGTIVVANTTGLGAVNNVLILNGGTVQLATDTAVNSKNVTVGGNSTITLDRATAGAGFATSFNNLTFSDTFTLTVNKGANVTSGTAILNFTGFPALGAAGKTAGFNVGTGVEVNLTGNLSGTQAFARLAKSGLGTLILSGVNDWWDPTSPSGLVTVSEGTLELRNSRALGDGTTGSNSIALSMAADTTVRVAADSGQGNYADLTLTGSNVTVVADRATAGAGITNQFDVLSIGAHTLNVTGGTNVTSGTTQVNFNSATLTGNATLNVVNPAAGSTNVLVSGVVSGAGYSLTKSGNGKVTLNGSNTYSGNTIVKAGTLALGSSGTIGSSPIIVVGDAGSSGAVLDTTAKSGFTIGASQTLMGIGTVNVGTGNTLNIEGTHAPGNSVGTQSVTGNLTYASGAIFEWDINASLDADGAGIDDGTAGTSFDSVNVTGNLVADGTSGTGSIFRVVFGSTAKADIEGGAGTAFWNTPSTTQVWDMLTLFGKSFTSGQFASVQTYDTSGAYDVSAKGSFTINGTSLTWTAVPEPSSALAGLLVGAGLLRRRRRNG